MHTTNNNIVPFFAISRAHTQMSQIIPPFGYPCQPTFIYSLGELLGGGGGGLSAFLVEGSFVTMCTAWLCTSICITGPQFTGILLSFHTLHTVHCKEQWRGNNPLRVPPSGRADGCARGGADF